MLFFNEFKIYETYFKNVNIFRGDEFLLLKNNLSLHYGYLFYE